MMHDMHHLTREDKLADAVRQAREGAMATGVWAYIHELDGERFLVSAEFHRQGKEPMCMVLPSLDVVWN